MCVWTTSGLTPRTSLTIAASAFRSSAAAGGRRSMDYATTHIELSSATLRIAARSTAAHTSIVNWSLIGLTGAPSLLLLAGAAVGWPWTLDAAVAQERLLGLIGCAVLSLLA